MADDIDPALRALLDAETRHLVRWRTVVGCTVALCIIPFYAVADSLVYPAWFQTLLVWRLIGMVLTGGILAALFSPVGIAHPEWLGLLLGGELGFTMSGFPVLLLGYATPASVGFMLTILGTALFIPLRLSYIVALSAGMVAMYVAAALVHGQIDSWGLFYSNVSFIVTASLVGLISMRAVARLRLREFSTRTALEAAVRDKTALAAALEQRTNQFQLANQEMEDLLYVASHDLRAPLINVQGFTREVHLGLDALRHELPGTPEARAVVADLEESIQFILTAVARMDALIGTLLNLSRIATRTTPTDVVPLGPMVDKIVDSFRYQLDQKQITIALADLPVVIGDPVRLNQAISNLIDNAIKYMGDRPVRRIEIGAQTTDGTCACFVRDSGPGIPTAKHDTVFRLFHRLANGTVPGEGIGLTMVRKIIEKHGGRVWVEGAPDEGSTFWFTLRLAPDSDRLPGG